MSDNPLLLLQLEADQITRLLVTVRRVLNAYEQAIPVIDKTALSSKQVGYLEALAVSLGEMRTAKDVLISNPHYWGKDVRRAVQKGVADEVHL